ncbi:MAG: glycosyltransferase family 39 protein [Candidatus Aenigmarchaeota archaeon]|nr:glycosyltransferase family 39 protein [Candidatus Aenigmarchaeota archaeon]
MTEEMEIKLSAESVAGFAALTICLFYLYLFESVTLNSPIAFGDEGFHAGTPKKIVETMEIPIYFEATKIYSGAYFRPPLPHLTYAGAMLAFGTSDAVTKILTPLFSLFTGMLLFLLAKKLHSKEAGLVAAFLYFITPSMITYNVLVYSEAPLIFFFTFFLYSFFSYLETNDKKFLLLSGITAGFVVLSKFTGLLVFPLMIILFLSLSAWKNNIKGFAALFVIALLVGASSDVRQIIAYNGVCQPRMPVDNQCYLGDAPTGIERDIGSFSGYVQQSGTNLSLFDIGIMNYVQFGYTSLVFLLFVAGIIFGLLGKNEKVKAMSFAGIFLYGLLTYATVNARTEDSIRATLLGVVPLFVLGGIYFADLVKNILKVGQNKEKLAAGIVIALSLFIAIYGYSVSGNRIDEMKSVKQFSPDYIEGCKWIDENIPPGSYTINLWGAPCQFYAPRINSVWTDMKELPDVLFSNSDEVVMPLLQRNGINYIVIAKFSISDSNVVTSTPVSFVNYVRGSEKFALVYENPATLVYKINYG